MKKTFRMAGMALMAILMCVNFASCSSNDDEEIGNQEKGKLLNIGLRNCFDFMH